MRQKFSVTREGRKELVLKEFSELEKKEYTIIYKTAYDLSAVSKAAGESVEALCAAMRSEVFFPPEPIMEKVAAAVVELLAAKDTDTVEVFIDDNNVADVEEAEIDLEDDEVEAEELDDILDDDDDDDLVDETND